MPRQHLQRLGVTRFDVLVPLVLLAFLVGLLLPAVQQARQADQRARCQNNLGALGLALHKCHDTYKELPPTAAFFSKANGQGTVFFFLLPFVGEDKLYKSAGASVWKQGVYATPVQAYLCPADATAPPDHQYKGYLATSNYAANWLVFSKGGARIPASFPDGTSNTIVFAERHQVCDAQPNAWGYVGYHYRTPMFMYYSLAKFQVQPSTEDNPCDPRVPQSAHAEGLPVTMGDGSARVVRGNVSAATWYSACTPAGGELLGADWNP
jgi:hypothetical protein